MKNLKKFLVIFLTVTLSSCTSEWREKDENHLNLLDAAATYSSKNYSVELTKHLIMTGKNTITFKELDSIRELSDKKVRKQLKQIIISSKK